MSSATSASASPRRPRRRLPLWAAIVAYVISVAIIVALIVGNLYATRYVDLISVYFGQSTQRIVTEDGEDADYYTSDFDSEEDRQEYLAQVATDISREGNVLISNDGALPLAADARVSVLGQDAVDPVYGGGGAGSIDPSLATSLQDGLEGAGLELNPVLWDFYTEGPGSDYRKTTPDVYGQGSFAVNEVPRDLYTSDVTDSFADYNDAAIVVLGRSGGESSDLASTPNEAGVTYLQLTAEEEDLLALASESFDSVIVLLNTQNPVELGPLADYDVSATLWIGALGQTGSTAVGEILTGAVNPSGALVDTYAYDSLSAPSMANFGNYPIVNSTVPMGAAYLVYGEGIYVGYRYYETRYADVVAGEGEAGDYDYASTVQYPFGHGESYTEFSWSDYAVAEQDDVFEVSVSVTNDGDVAGKDIVQVYLQSPYTDYDRENGIEKSAVELAGYGKTGMLEPGASETVTVTVPAELMKAYDAQGAGTYIVDAGDYVLTAADDAHAAINNVLAAQGYTEADGMDAAGDADFTWTTTVDELDTTTYAQSQATGEPIENRFQDVDIHYYDPSYTYLSRSDWTGTWPETFADGEWEAPEQMLADLEIEIPQDADAEVPAYDTIDEETGELTAAMLIGEDFDNPLWQTLLDQASREEIDELIRVGGYATRAVDSIQLPATTDRDGPAGFSATLVGGEPGMGYPPEIVLASSFNDDLAREMGVAIGEDSLALQTTGWYAPSMNIHRSPYSGRNFEYYSEDSVLSGRMGAAVVEGAQSKGTLVYIKHYALNDQETNRVGGSVFANEQSTRELYLEPFEWTVRESDARGVMASMNRVGATWSGGHAGLMTSALRDEWGFDGVVITDQASFEVFAYEDLREGMHAGTDLWLNTDADLWALDDSEITPTVEQDMRRAAHSIAYAVTNSNAMNGLSAGARIESVIPLWQWGLIAADVVLGIVAVGLIVFVTWRLVRQRRERRADVATE